jgi:acetyl esterase/lipase
MSLRLGLLNAQMRFFERPLLARARNPETLRRTMERKARIWLHGPRGAGWRQQTERGLDLFWVAAPGVSGDRVILYFHGGAYVVGSPHTHRALVAHLSRYSGHMGCLPAYRLAPENPFPAAIEDARLAYAILREAGYRPQQIVLGGDSAGGGLALALLGQLIAEGEDLPAGLFAFSPLTDLSFTAPSIRGNADKDVLLPADRAFVCAEYYLAGQDARDPRASPLFADMRGAPPVYLTVSAREILLDDTLRLVERLKADGVPVTLEMHQQAPHAWPVFHGLIPEAGETARRTSEWINSLWPTGDES